MSTQAQSTKGMVWFGLLFMAVGSFIIFSALDIIPTDESSFYAPRWVVAAAGWLFFAAGLTVSLMDSRLDVFRQSWWFYWMHGLAGLSIIFMFAFLLNWVAFGPGEREFSGGISIPFITISFDKANEFLGRVVFGIGALFFDVILVYSIGGAFWEWVKNWVNEE